MSICNDIDEVIGHLLGQFFITHHFLSRRVKSEVCMKIPWTESVMGNPMVEKSLDDSFFRHLVLHLRNKSTIDGQLLLVYLQPNVFVLFRLALFLFRGFPDPGYWDLRVEMFFLQFWPNLLNDRSVRLLFHFQSLLSI